MLDLPQTLHVLLTRLWGHTVLTSQIIRNRVNRNHLAFASVPLQKLGTGCMGFAGRVSVPSLLYSVRLEGGNCGHRQRKSVELAR